MLYLRRETRGGGNKKALNKDNVQSFSARFETGSSEDEEGFSEVPTFGSW
jgi:hypothetical protein